MCQGVFSSDQTTIKNYVSQRSFLCTVYPLTWSRTRGGPQECLRCMCRDHTDFNLPPTCFSASGKDLYFTPQYSMAVTQLHSFLLIEQHTIGIPGSKRQCPTMALVPCRSQGKLCARFPFISPEPIYRWIKSAMSKPHGIELWSPSLQTQRSSTSFT